MYCTYVHTSIIYRYISNDEGIRWSRVSPRWPEDKLARGILVVLESRNTDVLYFVQLGCIRRTRSNDLRRCKPPAGPSLKHALHNHMNLGV